MASCPFEFQAIAWHAEDVDASDASSDDDGPRDPRELRYVIKAFGRRADGSSASLTIVDFAPYFYLKLPNAWGAADTERLRSDLLATRSDCFKNMLAIDVVERKDLWGFTNFRAFKFARLKFRACKFMRFAAAYIRSRPIGRRTFKVYESNVEPYLRMFHERDVTTCGWIRAEQTVRASVLPSCMAHDRQTSYSNVKSFEGEMDVAFVVASFDLECMSYTGDFPVAKQDYVQVAQRVYDACRADAPDVTDYAKKNAAHRRTLECLSAVRFKAVADVDSAIRPIVDDIAALAASDADRAAAIAKIAEKLSNNLPPLEGDPIIQIGTTVHRYGSRAVERRVVLTLGTCESCESSEGRIEVFSCETEAELLRRWAELIAVIDPDVVAGYNIFGFDMPYVDQRARELGCEHEVYRRLNRLYGRTCEFKTQRLSSSALGDNLLSYIDMPGRVSLDLMKVVQRDHRLDSYKLDHVAEHFTGERKLDVSPKDIFRLHLGSAADRATVARYCVQDCELVNKLLIKLECLSNNIGMANVCYVPLTYIFMRGQGIKIFSLVLKQCFDDGFVVPALAKYVEDSQGEANYEGAIVLEPECGIYMDEPVTVLDYASLYPSSMISENLSHDCLVMDPAYGDLPGIAYEDIRYDVLDAARKKVGEKVCRFAQTTEGLIPRTLKKLLAARKATRKRMQEVVVERGGRARLRGVLAGDLLDVGDGRVERLSPAEAAAARPAHSVFQLAVLDGQQNAYKVTANSLYGQMGARTSQLYLMELAACTTATGRQMITCAKSFLEERHGARVVYGDTDSIFCIFPAAGKGHAAIAPAIACAEAASREFRTTIKRPHDLEYDKTFWPFILVSKKRYVGNVYEGTDAKFAQKSMGIVLKRRDNAPIVKKIFSGVIDAILNKCDIGESRAFLQRELERLVVGQCPLEDLVVSKSLRLDYKDPARIAHKVLAERMAERDPGNRPQVGDRIPYVYFAAPGRSKKALQGECIEHPQFVRDNGLAPDYHFYITNQIMRPVVQIYALIVEQLDGFSRPKDFFEQELRRLSRAQDDAGKKAQDKIAALREACATEILFEPLLRRLVCANGGGTEIDSFFERVSWD